MASHVETMLRQLRDKVGEHKLLRFATGTTTSAGASGGTTLVDTGRTELDDFWNGAETILTSGASEGARRLTEDSAASGTLTFTNNAFPKQVASSVTYELGEIGAWSSRDLRQYLIEGINFLAGALPKAVLRDYLRKQAVSSVNGVATLPTGIIDLHYLDINGKPAIPVPVERASRLISGEDTFANPTTVEAYLYHIRGASTTAAELYHAPAVNATVNVHYIPHFSDFDSSGNTTWPVELWDAAIHYAAGLAWAQNEEPELHNLWMGRLSNLLQAKGVKITLVLRQEGNK